MEAERALLTWEMKRIKRRSLFRDLEDVFGQRRGVKAKLNWGNNQVRLRATRYTVACSYTSTFKLSHQMISKLL